MSPESFKHYTLGIPEIDMQHKAIFDLILLATTMVNTGDTIDLLTVVASINTSTQDHIAYEEKLMYEMDYPFLIHHTLHHEDLSKAATELVHRFSDKSIYGHSSKTLARIVLDTFDKRLAAHIDYEDRQYADYLSIIRSS